MINRLQEFAANTETYIIPPSEYERILREEIPDGLILEFGVASGGSFQQICRNCAPRTCYGFDWFQGLPEYWKMGCEKGCFTCNGQPPTDIPGNGKIVMGLVEDTLEGFLKEHSGPVAFVHFDMDLYKPTKFCLDRLASRFVPDQSILLFDEILHCEGAKEHEERAFSEFLYLNGFDCKVRFRRGIEKWAFTLSK